MITEDYVSFKTAKLLKEKGFDEQCYAYYNIFYDNDGKDLKLWRKYPHRAQPNTNYLNVPTLQTAMKWFREVHNISIEPFVDFGSGEGYWWTADVGYIKKDGLVTELCGYDSYEKAAEAAIKYCLENLI